VGLVIALVAVVASLVTDDAIYDGYGTLAIGMLLTGIAVVLATEMKSLLIGESADQRVLETIRSAIEVDPAVDRLIHMRTQHLGPEELLVAAKVGFVDTLTVRELSEAVNRVEANIRREVPEAGILYIEPDVTGADLPDDPLVPGRRSEQPPGPSPLPSPGHRPRSG